MTEIIWYILLIGSIVLLALELLFCIRGFIRRLKEAATDDDEEESTDA